MIRSSARYVVRQIHFHLSGLKVFSARTQKDIFFRPIGPFIYEEVLREQLLGPEGKAKSGTLNPDTLTLSCPSLYTSTKLCFNVGQ